MRHGAEHHELDSFCRGLRHLVTDRAGASLCRCPFLRRSARGPIKSINRTSGQTNEAVVEDGWSPRSHALTHLRSNMLAAGEAQCASRSRWSNLESFCRRAGCKRRAHGRDSPHPRSAVGRPQPRRRRRPGPSPASNRSLLPSSTCRPTGRSVMARCNRRSSPACAQVFRSAPRVVAAATVHVLRLRSSG